MSLISKRTYCFNCGEPTWIQGEFVQKLDRTYPVKHDSCTTCNYSKLTSAASGIVDYYDVNGKPVNLMTNDPRRGWF